MKKCYQIIISLCWTDIILKTIIGYYKRNYTMQKLNYLNCLLGRLLLTYICNGIIIYNNIQHK